MSFERCLNFLCPPGGIGLENTNLTHCLMLFGFSLTIVIIGVPQRFNDHFRFFAILQSYHNDKIRDV